MSQPHYRIHLFWSAEDRCWIADAPDLKPCSGHGDTKMEAIANINGAIEGWLAVAKDRGFPIPDARYSAATYTAA